MKPDTRICISFASLGPPPPLLRLPAWHIVCEGVSDFAIFHSVFQFFSLGAFKLQVTRRPVSTFPIYLPLEGP